MSTQSARRPRVPPAPAGTPVDATATATSSDRASAGAARTASRVPLIALTLHRHGETSTRSRNVGRDLSVMGVVNVTPDSFSDGGVEPRARPSRRRSAADARGRRRDRRHRRRVDAARGGGGARSTRSCAASCPCWSGSQGVPVSIDTSKAEVARRALELGAELVNDVTALRGDPELAGVVADAGAYLCLMHMQGEPRTMQVDPRYDDVVSEVAGVPRGAARVRGRAGHPRGAGLPRPRHRLRQDAPSRTSSSCGGSTCCRARPARRSSGSRARARSARLLGDPRRRPGTDAASRRRCRRRLRPRCDDLPRARRPRARRGAGRGGGGAAG